MHHPHTHSPTQVRARPGEKYPAAQRCVLKAVADGKATIAVTTEFKTPPESAQERLPFLQKDLAGEVVGDLRSGRLVRVQYQTDKTIENHQGTGSSYRFQSRYTEELLPAGTVPGIPVNNAR